MNINHLKTSFKKRAARRASASLLAALSLAACGPQSGAPVAANGNPVPMTAVAGTDPALNAAGPMIPAQGGTERQGQSVPGSATIGARNHPGYDEPDLQARSAYPAPATGYRGPVEAPLQSHAQTPYAPTQDEVAPPARAPARAHNAQPVASAHLGEIRSIEPIRTRPEGSGTGAVIGGVLGAVVGNQFGHGGGRAVTTVLGGVGGAVAGNNLERNHREGIAGYRVNVRLDNGSSRTFNEADASEFRVGDRVRVDRGQLRPL